MEKTKLGYLSMTDTIKALDCSRSFIYKLMEKKIITPKYLLKKPYFSIQEIENAMTPQSAK